MYWVLMSVGDRCECLMECLLTESEVCEAGKLCSFPILQRLRVGGILWQ